MWRGVCPPVCPPVCPTDSLSHICPKNSICLWKKTFTHQVFVSFHYCVVVVTVLKKITATVNLHTETVNVPPENILPPCK